MCPVQRGGGGISWFNSVQFIWFDSQEMQHLQITEEVFMQVLGSVKGGWWWHHHFGASGAPVTVLGSEWSSSGSDYIFMNWISARSLAVVFWEAMTYRLICKLDPVLLIPPPPVLLVLWPDVCREKGTSGHYNLSSRDWYLFKQEHICKLEVLHSCKWTAQKSTFSPPTL